MRIRRLLVLLCAVVTASAGAPARADAEVADVPLRLSDLAPGYLVGDDSGCGLRLGDEGLAPALRALERDHPYAACGIQFERAWPRAGSAPLVESYAFAFERPEGADAAFRARRALTAYATGLAGRSLKARAVADPLGEATAVFRTDAALVRGRGGRAGVALVWRSGAVVSVVLVAGRGRGLGEELFRLARVQQGRIETPTPLAPADNDDRDVPLDHPRLAVPVWWLGDGFTPPAPLPALVLSDAAALGDGSGWDATIDDETADGEIGLTLGVWRPRAFARFERTRLGRLVRGRRCARSTRIDLRTGRAVIRAGYAHPPRRCDQRTPDVYLADVHLDGVVVTVNLPHCLLCVGRAPGDLYNSEAGMRAVAEGLLPRP